MTLLDATALIALLRGEPASESVEAEIAARRAVILAINLAEVADVLQRRFGVSEEELRSVLEPILAEALPVWELSIDAAWRGGTLRARAYRRSDTALSLADCVLVATALAGDHAIATIDRALAAGARDEGAQLLALAI